MWHSFLRNWAQKVIASQWKGSCRAREHDRKLQYRIKIGWVETKREASLPQMKLSYTSQWAGDRG